MQLQQSVVGPNDVESVYEDSWNELYRRGGKENGCMRLLVDSNAEESYWFVSQPKSTCLVVSIPTRERQLTSGVMKSFTYWSEKTLLSLSSA